MSIFETLSIIEIISLYGPAGIGFVLSIYNWYIARRGAVLRLTESFRFGIIQYQSGRKLIYFPLDVMNFGTSVGKVDEVNLQFIDDTGTSRSFRPTRRVSVNPSDDKKDGLTQNDLQDNLPVFPVFCYPQEGISEIFEYYEDTENDEDIMKGGKEYQGIMEMRYNGTKHHEIPFRITFPEIGRNTITWSDIKYD